MKAQRLRSRSSTSWCSFLSVTCMDRSIIFWLEQVSLQNFPMPEERLSLRRLCLRCKSAEIRYREVFAVCGEAARRQSARESAFRSLPAQARYQRKRGADVMKWHPGYLPGKQRFEVCAAVKEIPASRFSRPLTSLKKNSGSSWKSRKQSIADGSVRIINVSGKDVRFTFDLRGIRRFFVIYSWQIAWSELLYII